MAWVQEFIALMGDGISCLDLSHNTFSSANYTTSMGLQDQASPLTNRIAAVLSWVIPLVWTYGIQTKESILGGLFLPACIFGYCCFYVVSHEIIERVVGKEAASEMYGSYPAASYYLSLLHCFGTITFLWVIAALVGPRPETLGLSSLTDSQFMLDGWNHETSSHSYMQQVHCAIISYLVKDFYLYDSQQNVFVLHHILSIAGSTMCLSFPALAGLITFNAAQAEFASGLYNFVVLYPTSIALYSYLVVMGISNVLIAHLTLALGFSEIHWPWRGTYCGLASVIFAIRCAGWVILGLDTTKKERTDDAKKD